MNTVMGQNALINNRRWLQELNDRQENAQYKSHAEH